MEVYTRYTPLREAHMRGLYPYIHPLREAYSGRHIRRFIPCYSRPGRIGEVYTRIFPSWRLGGRVNVVNVFPSECPSRCV